jgi:ankyrin repeat protein
LAQACLGVLLRLDKHITKDNASKIPLANYAARHWVDHAQFEDVSSRIQDMMEYFFDADKPHWTAWHRVYDMDYTNWRGFTPNPVIPNEIPLYYAALCGFYDLAVHLVVKNPEHVNSRGGRMITPLIAALHRGHYRVADLLHRHCADMNARGASERTVLHVAARDGLVDIVQWLLDHGADVNARNVHGNTPLTLIDEARRPEISRMLLERHADVNVRGEHGKTALHWSANFGDMFDAMQLFLEHGADPNTRDDDGRTPLHDSCRSGAVEDLRLLLDHGADMDARDNDGMTPLQTALEAGHQDLAKILLERGAK